MNEAVKYGNASWLGSGAPVQRTAPSRDQIAALAALTERIAAEALIAALTQLLRAAELERQKITRVNSLLVHALHAARILTRTETRTVVPSSALPAQLTLSPNAPNTAALAAHAA